MTADAPTFAQTIDIIRNRYNVRSVTVSDDARRVAVSARIYYDPDGGDLAPYSEALLVDVGERLEPFGFIHMDSEVADSNPNGCDAVEVWLFEHS